MTNREKFIEVFDEIPQTACPLIECEHTKCPYNDGHTNCINQQKNMSMWWELEYLSITRNRIIVTFKDEKENIFLFDAKFTINGNVGTVEGKLTTSPDASYMIFHFRMADVKHIKEVFYK